MKHIVFISAVSLRNGRGTERVLFEYITNKPNGIKVTLIQTDIINQERLNTAEWEEIEKKCTVYTLKSFDKKFNFMKKNIVLQMINELLFRPLVLKYMIRTKYRHIIEAVRESGVDSVYLGFNELKFIGDMISNNIVLSSHNMIHSHGFIKSIQFKLLMAGLYYRGIKGFHFLPVDRFWYEKFNKRKIMLPNSIPTNKYYHRKRNRDDKIRLLYVGNLERRKGIFLLKEIWEKLDTNMFELDIVGIGPEIKWVQNWSKSDLRVRYHGYLTDSSLAELYGNCDVFVYPSMADHFSLVVLQAISSGLYSIIPEGLKGTFDEFELRGVLEYCPIDPNCFVISLKNLIKEYPSKKDLLLESHSLVEQKYDSKNISSKLFEFMVRLSNDSNSN